MKISSPKQLKIAVALILLISFLYCSLSIIYPYLYSGVFNKNIVPNNVENLQIVGEMSSYKNLNVAVIGDSTALGVGTDSVLETFSYQFLNLNKSKFSNISYFNFGKNGATSQGLVDAEIEKLSKGNFDIVFVSIGANDVTARVSTETYKNHIETIANYLEKLKIDKVIWLSIPDFITSPILLPPLSNYLSSKAKELNEVSKPIITGKGFSYIDVYDSTRDLFLKDKSSFSKDGYHPSKTGYGNWAGTIDKQIRI